MKQHPIPQDITGYKFHLIGSMTLKQFAELAVGALVAFIVYKSNLIGVVRWPLFIFIVLLSIMIAFVPIEERPLDFWIVTFFKNLWKPTKFFWKRTPKVPDFFNYKPGLNQNLKVDPEVNYSPAKKQRIQEYLKSIPENDEELDEWDHYYNKKAQDVVANYSQVEVKAENVSIKPEKEANKPQLKTRIRKLKNLDEVREKNTQDNLQNSMEVNEEPIVSENKQADNNYELIKNTFSEEAQAQIKSENNTKLEAQQANQLVGTVIDTNGQGVNNALVEIFAADQDQALRIIKTNVDGQFYIKTALPNGEYLIKTEAEGLIFAPLGIRLTGKLVPTIEIVAD
jgi:hypothetical protein